MVNAPDAHLGVGQAAGEGSFHSKAEARASGAGSRTQGQKTAGASDRQMAETDNSGPDTLENEDLDATSSLARTATQGAVRTGNVNAIRFGTSAAEAISASSPRTPTRIGGTSINRADVTAFRTEAMAVAFTGYTCVGRTGPGGASARRSTSTEDRRAAT